MLDVMALDETRRKKYLIWLMQNELSEISFPRVFLLHSAFDYAMVSRAFSIETWNEMKRN